MLTAVTRVKRLWSLRDLDRMFGKRPGYFAYQLATQRTFPAPDFQVGARTFAWDPGRETEIGQWLKDREHFKALRAKQRRESVLRYVRAPQLPPVPRTQALTRQGLAAEPQIIAVPARAIKVGDVRPWGGVVDRIPQRDHNGRLIIHDDVLGSPAGPGFRVRPDALVFIRPRPGGMGSGGGERSRP